MNTVGIFAGRGDVIVAMALAGIVGTLIGWYVRGLVFRARARWFNQNTEDIYQKKI